MFSRRFLNGCLGYMLFDSKCIVNGFYVLGTLFLHWFIET